MYIFCQKTQKDKQIPNFKYSSIQLKNKTYNCAQLIIKYCQYYQQNMYIYIQIYILLIVIYNLKYKLSKYKYTYQQYFIINWAQLQVLFFNQILEYLKLGICLSFYVFQQNIYINIYFYPGIQFSTCLLSKYQSQCYIRIFIFLIPQFNSILDTQILSYVSMHYEMHQLVVALQYYVYFVHLIQSSLEPSCAKFIISHSLQSIFT
eukprot:TRINITY_DN3907_c0_g1_i1.p5 TRINITY_DN3907_c0_g1~~TRINITY_DN3907_c0_g1_i1.p5  ORF type:complete len:205 (+),score=-13.07 TRINITY_DN3907_c0_g1_i1:1165-1779(+)